MIDELWRRGELSVIEDSQGLIGYRLSGGLYDAFELLDSALAALLVPSVPVTRHSCPPLIDAEALGSFGFLDRLPSIPFDAVPHTQGVSDGTKRLLSPSACYHSFAHLKDSLHPYELQTFQICGFCHRFEPGEVEPTRAASFQMRELVLLGPPEAVVTASEIVFARAVDLVTAIAQAPELAVANDVFYGERASVAKKLQRAARVKIEMRMPVDGRSVAVGSRNFHHDLFTRAFEIAADTGGVLHSSCVAFGLERLLFGLLQTVPNWDSEALSRRIRVAADLEMRAIG